MYNGMDGEKAQATGWARKRRRQEKMRCEGKQMTQTGYRYAEMRLRHEIKINASGSKSRQGLFTDVRK